MDARGSRGVSWGPVSVINPPSVTFGSAHSEKVTHTVLNSTCVAPLMPAV